MTGTEVKKGSEEDHLSFRALPCRFRLDVSVNTGPGMIAWLGVVPRVTIGRLKPALRSTPSNRPVGGGPTGIHRPAGAGPTGIHWPAGAGPMGIHWPAGTGPTCCSFVRIRDSLLASKLARIRWSSRSFTARAKASAGSLTLGERRTVCLSPCSTWTGRSRLTASHGAAWLGLNRAKLFIIGLFRDSVAVIIVGTHSNFPLQADSRRHSSEPPPTPPLQGGATDWRSSEPTPTPLCRQTRGGTRRNPLQLPLCKGERQTGDRPSPLQLHLCNWESQTGDRAGSMGSAPDH
jgi:hypothetical protein